MHGVLASSEETMEGMGIQRLVLLELALRLPAKMIDKVVVEVFSTRSPPRWVSQVVALTG